MRTITVAERRARLTVRHHLAPEARADGVVDVARDLLALHSTDPASVYVGLWARLREPSMEGIERALYEDRTLVRMLGMRRTVFVVPVEVAPVIDAAVTRAVLLRERRQLVQLVERSGVAEDGLAWLSRLQEAALRELVARGEASGAELSAAVPGMREQIVISDGKAYGGPVGVASRVLFLLAAEGRIVRGRPRGTWLSTQHRWVPMEAWLPGPAVELTTEAARVELIRRWLSAFGPGTVGDIKWWTGLTLGEVRKALAEIAPAEVGLDDGGTGLVLADDVESPAAPEPAVALLPSLDTTVMAWKDRSWYLGPHVASLFDRSGNAGPTIWWGGRVVGGWAQREDRSIVVRLLEDVGREVVALVEAEAHRLETWIGPVRVVPRFWTPLERELVS